MVCKERNNMVSYRLATSLLYTLLALHVQERWLLHGTLIYGGLVIVNTLN